MLWLLGLAKKLLPGGNILGNLGKDAAKLGAAYKAGTYAGGAAYGAKTEFQRRVAAARGQAPPQLPATPTKTRRLDGVASKMRGWADKKSQGPDVDDAAGQDVDTPEETPAAADTAGKAREGLRKGLDAARDRGRQIADEARRLAEQRRDGNDGPGGPDV